MKSKLKPVKSVEEWRKNVDELNSKMIWYATKYNLPNMIRNLFVKIKEKIKK